MPKKKKSKKDGKPRKSSGLEKVLAALYEKARREGFDGELYQSVWAALEELAERTQGCPVDFGGEVQELLEDTLSVFGLGVVLFYVSNNLAEVEFQRLPKVILGGVENRGAVVALSYVNSDSPNVAKVLWRPLSEMV